jgi:hypothetical protein
VGGGEFVHVVDFAIRSAASVKWLTIPGRVSFFRVTGGSRRGLVAFRRRRRRGRRGVSVGYVSGTLGGLGGSLRRVRWLERRRLAPVSNRLARGAAIRKTYAEDSKRAKYAERK